MSIFFHYPHLSPRGVEVLYGGTDVFDHEVNQAIIHDLILALVSLSLVVTVVFVLTGTGQRERLSQHYLGNHKLAGADP